MPKVHEIDGFLIKVNTRGEHNPPHVHVLKNGWEITVEIGAAAKFRGVKHGRPSLKDLNTAIDHVQTYLDACNASWSANNAHL